MANFTAAIAKLLLTALCLAFAQPVLAQSTSTYVVTANGAIDGTTSCTSPLVRNFSVSDTFIVSDVDLGVFATHTWRGDLQITLQAPDTTRVQLVDGDVNNTSGDNFNVLLDDAATTTVNSTNPTGNQSTAAPPPFANTFSPNSPLAAFNGTASNGIWQLEICDLLTGADDGTFQHAELYLTAQPTNFADLSLTKTLIGSPPIQGGTATWRLTITNDATSINTATGVVVRDTFPGGFGFTNASGDGSFNSGTGDWTVGSLAPGQSASITLTGTVTAATGTTLTNTAEIIASSEVDPDSTPNNGNTFEDDFSSSSFTVQSGRAPGVPPVLSCPAGFSMFDWDAIPSWTAGSEDNTYTFASFGNVRFQLTNDGAYINNTAFGGQSPTVFDVFEGGLNPQEDSLTLVANQANQTGEVELTITLPRSFTGLQFTIFDVDFNAGQFSDRVEVIGSNNGSNVTPTLTNGNVNFVVGNEAFGDGGSGSPEALGNVVVTFNQAVDTVVLRYGNHSTAPTNPGQQGIGVHDITVCNPFAQLSVTKVSSVIADPVNGTTNPKAIPGATVEYLITVTNTGTDAADTDSVEVWDDGPADAKMCLISRAGGPVIFADPGNNSGLTYNFTALNSDTDDVEFSNDNAEPFDHDPTADSDDCDAAITDFRVRPSGAFAGGSNFTLRVRYQVE